MPIIRCPFCEEHRRVINPLVRAQTWEHPCTADEGRKVWFLNGYAIKGIGAFQAADAATAKGTLPPQPPA